MPGRHEIDQSKQDGRNLDMSNRFLSLAVLVALTLPLPAAAKDPGQDAYMIRVLACEGPDAKMEVYLPQSIVVDNAGSALAKKLANPAIGYYTLDLTDSNKGKSLEPVKVSMTPDAKTVTVNQYTRKLKPTSIPVGGGTVDFDQRFGTGAKCSAFGM
jgi:hypothetical protein